MNLYLSGTNSKYGVLTDCFIYQFFMPLRQYPTVLQMKLATSCGTLVINKKGEILLCHVTGANHWDIPKGLQEPGELTLNTAKRELREETGLEFDEALFEEIGSFDYMKEKRLHLYKVHAPDLDSLGHLICTSHFPHHVTGEPTPEMDGFCWATRDDVRTLCTPRMASRLLSLDW
jgi:putative (di)nucleoside polyphosphate hydrolase